VEKRKVGTVFNLSLRAARNAFEDQKSEKENE